MRLIDADRLESLWLTDEARCGDYTAYHFTESIQKEPSIDAVTVVRCKDCRNHDRTKELKNEVWCPVFGKYGGGFVGKDFYCAWGERKDDAVD